jgi:hypothetical protein
MGSWVHLGSSRFVERGGDLLPVHDTQRTTQQVRIEARVSSQRILVLDQLADGLSGCRTARCRAHQRAQGTREVLVIGEPQVVG